MWIIKETKTIKLPEDSCQRFFIQTWYSLIHRNSLDSHRVRCMNALNILREIFDLFQKPKLPGVFKDIRKTAEEALAVLERDRVIARHFYDRFQNLKPLLVEIAKDDKSKSIDNNQNIKLASYYIRDFLVILKDKYKTNILSDLEEAIFKTCSEEDIFDLTNALLSTLIDEGHSLEELFSIVQYIFISNKSEKTYSFGDNFQLMKRIADHDDYQYEIIFRLENCRSYELLPSKIVHVHFEKEPAVDNTDDKVKSLLTPGLNVVFARIKTPAQDDRSAGIKAKDRLDEVLDLIRFELEHETIDVDREFVSIRLNELTSRVFKLPGEIPNPKRGITTDEFESFVKEITDIFENHSIDRESKEKIKSAIRFYRIGRDSDQFENKYVNWWTALEYLLRSEEGDIIGTIENKLRTILAINYVEKRLHSFRNAISCCGVNPSIEACERFKISSFGEIGIAEFFYLLKNNDEFAHIIRQLDINPAVRYRLQRFADHIKDAKSLETLLDLHEKHVIWHIHRIWRIRCDIVHSAEYSLNLTLLSANLEYYLKYLLNFILRSLGKNQAIGNLNELFDRITYVYGRLRADLRNGNLSYHDELLKGHII